MSVLGAWCAWTSRTVLLPQRKGERYEKNLGGLADRVKGTIAQRVVSPSRLSTGREEWRQVFAPVTNPSSIAEQGSLPRQEMGRSWESLVIASQIVGTCFPQ